MNEAHWTELAPDRSILESNDGREKGRIEFRPDAWWASTPDLGLIGVRESQSEAQQLVEQNV